MRLRAALFLVFLAVPACDPIAEHVVLSPAGAGVEFAMDTPSDNAYKMVGAIEGVAGGKDANEAEQAARNDLRNKAAALGASLVTVDSSKTEVLRLQDKQKVTIKGRAFKAID